MSSELLELLWKTVLLRPYVFAFLVVYILSASLHIGFTRALAYVPTGYGIAWCSEWLSTHYGVPYGFYRYIPSTADRELWIGGIPFMDSLSYVFLSYAAYGTTKFLWLKSNPRGNPRSWKFTFAGAGFLTLMDVIIDPVALQGDRWFLGKIYEYPSGGIYFGVPLSNFLGWFIVGIALTRLLQYLGKQSFPRTLRSSLGLYLAVCLYVSVIIFNVSVAIYIKAWEIVFADFVIILLTVLIVMKIVRGSLRSSI